MLIDSIPTPIEYLGSEFKNEIYVKREDFIPFSFGGNKARKALLFFEDYDAGNYDCVVTYGSSSSNHCRIISNIACKKRIPCYIISPNEASEPTYNSKMMELFGAEIITVPLEMVHDTIENKVFQLIQSGKNPYFIPGGGHGDIGTQAYVNCYSEIKNFEKKNNIQFDYIFHASGTGTTQAGLVCGKILCEDSKKIIGISIARKNPRGRQVIVDSVSEYFQHNNFHFDDNVIEKSTFFLDDYIGNGYGSRESAQVVMDVLMKYGLPLDCTYTGKAFFGMMKYIETNYIQGKRILFIHTGGTPLFFDYLKRG